MHCKLDIEKSIIKKALEGGTTKNIKPFGSSSLLVNKKDFPKPGQTFKIANEKANDLNERFGDNIANVNQVTDGHEIVIKPSKALIDDYYDGYIKTVAKAEQVESGIDRFGDSRIEYKKTDPLENKILGNIVKLQDLQESLQNLIGTEVNLDLYTSSTEGVELGKGILTKEIYEKLNSDLQSQIDDLYNSLDQIKSQAEAEKDIFDKYIPDIDKYSTTSILNNIISNSDETSQEYKVAKTLLSLQDKNKTATVTIVDKFTEDITEDSETTEAFFRTDENKIYLSKENINKFGEERFKQTFLHELLHSYTLFPFYKENENKLSKVEKEFFNDIAKLYLTSKKYAKNKSLYGYTNAREFITEIITNPTFREEIKSLKLNIWDRIINAITKFINNNSIFETSEKVIYDFLLNIEKVQTNKNLQREERQQIKKAPKQPIKTFEEQYVFFKRRINRLQKDLDKVSPNSDQHTILEAELATIIERFEKATEEQDREEYVALAKDYLMEIDNLSQRLPENPDQYIIQELTDAFEALNTFKDFKGVRDIVEDLREKLFPYIIKHNLKQIQHFDTSGEIITEETIDNQEKDVRWSAGAFGSLLDSINLIGRTIGSLIKSAQNRASLQNKELEVVVQSQVDKLSEYAKTNGMTLEQVYDIFIQDSKQGTTQLANRYKSNGELNPNYDKIQNTPELKEFYDFYQKTLKYAEANLPYKVGKFYILNKPKSDVASDIKRVLLGETVMFDSFVSNEELIADMVPEMFRRNIPADKKSRDLGAGLLEFAAYANNHNELSKVLPETRLLQEQLKYKQNSDGSIEERKFIKADDPSKKVSAEDSNIYQQVKTIINMQLKGKMTDNKLTPIKTVKIKDKEGNETGYKQVHIEDFLDKGLRLNSLIRIGLSPVTAMSNVIFGGISNFIEAVGGKFFTVSDLTKANNVFFKQIDFISDKQDSNLYKWLIKLNPLQELADYELGSGLKAQPKKLTLEKATEMMYAMQKKGELKLQATTMLAMLIHDGYMNPDGSNTTKGDNITEEEASKLSDKVQRLNQQIHGRYTQREAAALQQSVWFRMAFQFRKWIPAAIESRFGDPRYDNRLQDHIEGRYRTLKNKVFKADNVQDAFLNMFQPLFNSKAALERGNMTPTEVYNMRKNMVEMILLLSTVLLAAWLKSGDDEEERKKLKNPYIKMSLTMLNRISGDLNFFYNPSNIGNMAANAVPMSKLIKDVIKVGVSLPHAFYLGDYEVKKGSLKGSNSFYSKDLPKILPGFAPAAQLQKIINDEDILIEL